MRKKLGVVQVATESTQNPENKQTERDIPATSTNDTSRSSKPAQLPIDLSGIDPGKIAMAEKFGLPVGAILSWMKSVEERFNTIEEVLPRKVGEELQKAIDKARSEQAAKQPPPEFQVPQQSPGPAPSPMPSGMAGILGLLPEILKSQPQNDMLSELAQKALRGQIAMSEAITNAVVSKIAARATDKVAEAVTGA